ncbi:hypothetical protein [Streptomyces sp. cg36]|uniref:hypothetical protein n=1 Tax=Streptomyces sp. cg36 TaxID=3238798 RepID=UPI0034E19A6F
MDHRALALIAGRGCLVVDEEIRDLLAREHQSGAAHDATVAAPCVNRRPGKPADRAGSLRSFLDAADRVHLHLADLGLTEEFQALLHHLLAVETWATEPDDLVLHRCLHAAYAITETHARALLAALDPTAHHEGFEEAGYEKGDANTAVLDSAAGPVLGHHHYLSPLVATCADSRVGLRAAFLSYADAIMTYMPDWESLPREQGMAAAITTAFGTSVAKARRTSLAMADPQWRWLRRNAIGTITLRWFARIDEVARSTGNGSLLHTGILCALPDPLRRLTLLCLGYGQFGL